jgi:hypothetical protein
MLDWIIKVHPYLASLGFLVLWCSLGYLQGRFISPVFACVTWSLAILASVLALIEMPSLGPLGWILAIPILLGGSTWLIYYYRRVSRRVFGGS